MISPLMIAGEVLRRYRHHFINLPADEIRIAKWSATYGDMNLLTHEFGTKLIPLNWECHSLLAYPMFAGIDIDTKAEVSCGGLQCIVVYQYRITHDDYMIKAWVKKDE